MDIYSKKSGQIPAFGNWDYANDLPITQYFESAREAGLLNYSCSGECDLNSTATATASGFQKPPHTAAHPKRPENRGAAAKDKTRHQHKKKHSNARALKTQNDDVYRPKVKIVNIMPKPVDEDLYKIPPELLHTSKKKKMLRFFTSCWN